jgi:hypothetical protein
MAEDIENIAEPERIDPPVVAEKSALTLPMILTLSALTLYFGFQTLQLLNERNNLAMVKSSQEAAIQEAQKVQAQFKTLVAKTSELADKGHAGAKMVMEELLKRGVGAAPQPGAPSEMKPPAKTETKPAK